MNGVIDWFARNHVAANLLVVGIFVAGLMGLWSGKREVFPSVSSDMISVSVVYRGAAPSEVEQGVCIKIEEAIQGIEGIKKILSTATEGLGTTRAELVPGTDIPEALEEIKSAVEAIDTFPQLTEKPVIEEIVVEKQVINVAIAGEVGAMALRQFAELVRDDLTAIPDITQVRLANARPYEISIEVSPSALRQHGLTFDAVAAAIRSSSVDLPGGGIKTNGGEILLRSIHQAYRGEDFESILLMVREDGTRVLVKDVCRVIDGFRESDQESLFDGKPCLMVQVFRVGNQNALTISSKVQEYVENQQSLLPAGIQMTTWQDDASYLRSRQELLVKNGFFGLALVFATLALFLRFGLAAWVSVGLFVSFMGTLWLMPIIDVSINLLSLFAFILVLGIVVDDAIVVSENIHSHQQRDGFSLLSAIRGTQEVGKPVIFAVLTTVAAFLPLVMVPGNTGKIMRGIPLVVIPTLLFSLVESLLVLPCHLSHRAPAPFHGNGAGLRSFWGKLQGSFTSRLEDFVHRTYRPFLQVAIEWRYVTLACGLGFFLLTLGLMGGGWVRFQFFPPVEGDNVAAILTMPEGTSSQETLRAVHALESSAQRVRAEADVSSSSKGPSPTSVFRHTLSSIGQQPFFKTQQEGAGKFVPDVSNAHLGEVHVELVPSEERVGASSYQLASAWRDATQPIPGVESLKFTASIFSAGEPINLQITGRDFALLEQAGNELRKILARYPGVKDISDTLKAGKSEIQLEIKPRAEVLGLSQAELGRQVRQAFYGEEVQRIQRGRDDMRVMVRFPKIDRSRISTLESMMIRTSDGREVPLEEVATLQWGTGFSSIERVDRRRAINILADVDVTQANTTEIIRALDEEDLPSLLAKYPGLTFSWQGERREQQETIAGIASGYPLALIIIYALLAVPFRSYTQPLIVMSAIPFGLIGAVFGHILMGMDLTILSMFGIVALSGVVVNDNLVLVVYINRMREEGMRLGEAVLKAGVARFRPILLTSLTTFVGLMPLILEKSVQAQFLIPMAISLAFGVMFATVISLILVPIGYLLLEDIKSLFISAKAANG